MKTARRRRSKGHAVSRRRGPEKKRSSKGLQLRRILVPIDFSRQSTKALRYALSLASKFDAEVRLLHVIDPGEEPSPAIIRMPLVTEPETMVRIAGKLLQSWAVRFRIPVSKDTCTVTRGRIFRKIVAAASEMKADLIVLATHGYTGFKRVIHGSTAERVVQHSRCPVLIVRAQEQEFLDRDGSDPAKRGVISIKKILVPVDFSNASRAGIRYAALLAARFGATLRLFHAIDPYAETIGGEPIPGETMSLMEAVYEVTSRQMDRLRQSAILAGIKCETEIRIGSPVGRDLLRDPGRGGFRSLLLSTHGYGGLRRALLGGVAKQVVRCARCPLITVPIRFKPNK